MSEKIRACVLVEGRVQGVFFRQNTFYKAREIGVFGFVRNLPDGRVEAVFEGDKNKVEKMIEWIKEGPEYAKVEKCKVLYKTYKREFEDFKIRH